ncbi:MAG: peptidase [Xanthomonadales bacterium]|nr:peptidase [Gammaproteobacteria bacterium]NNK04888.1 peptidase [Xanthomonadales bacterium]
MKPDLRRKALTAVVLLIALFSVHAHAGDDFVFWPNADYDPAIPTFEDVLGYNPGERITWHGDAVRYFEALANAAPKRLSVKPYASSWEGRELIYAVVTSAENLANIEVIKSGMQRLADPRRTSPAEAREIIKTQPAVTWLSYGVHGNEISSTEAAMLTAYHLLASRGDERVANIMRDTVVVIDPMQNPDGRDRFIHHFETAEGLLPDADRISAEHDEPWPGGRTNHYLFDLNRDWFMMTQPETRGRVRILREWFPVAFVDAHEMGSDSTYYFAPEAVPYNPHLAADQRASLALFGKNNARWFDTFGLDYYTREVFDAFYPGYGASWPSYFGSIAMTYEQASARGLVVRQYDGNELTFAYTIRNHFVTSLATAETTAANREKFLVEFYNYQESAIEEGKSENVRAYILPTQADQAGAAKLAGLLTVQGVEVGRAGSSFTACGNSYPAGSYVIDLAQPAKRFIRTLMDADVPMDDDFIAEQERRRAKNMRDQIYDVTGWSLPKMMNIRADRCNRTVKVESTPVGPDLTQAGSVSEGAGSVAYLVPWGTAPAVRFLSHALRQGLDTKSSDKAFTHAGQRYPAGTLIIDTADNPGDLRDIVTEISTMTGANVVSVDNSWVSDGPNFGSENVVRFNPPKVAIAWDEPTSSYSAGNTRFVIERQFDYPVTAIRGDRLGRVDLSRYQVLILPATGWGPGYADVLGKKGAENLKDWVSKGGVLIAIGNANRYLTDPDIDLLSIRRENAVIEADNNSESPAGNGKKNSDKPQDATVEGQYLTSAEDYKQAITPVKDNPDSVAGVLAQASVDPDHWLGAGVAPRLNVLVRGSDIYTPIKMDKGVNVAVFSAADELLNSGYIWEQNRKQLAFKPFVVAQRSGRGYVIGFTQDPNVRAYLDGLNTIFMNAIMRGSAHARPAR